MDYLFYGDVTTHRTGKSTSFLINIARESDEKIELYQLVSNETDQLVYEPLKVENFNDHILAEFDVPNDQVMLFAITGKSNELDIPFTQEYIVFNGEVIPSQQNEVIDLDGVTFVFFDGTRKTL